MPERPFDKGVTPAPRRPQDDAAQTLRPQDDPAQVRRQEGDAEQARAAEPRHLRADAQRNYAKLVVAAREAFATDGEAVSMEAVARRAGVGVGTLYRHFPKRIDLVQAVYQDDVEDLVQTARRDVHELEPWPAVASFLEAFIRYARGKRTFLNELREAFARDPDLKLALRERIDGAMALVIGRAQRAGAIRSDLEATDVMQLLGPMCTSPTLTEDQIERLLPVILDGLQAGQAGQAGQASVPEPGSALAVESST